MSGFENFIKIFASHKTAENWHNTSLEDIKAAFPVGTQVRISNRVKVSVTDSTKFDYNGLVTAHQTGCNRTERTVVWVNNQAFLPEDLIVAKPVLGGVS